ncbi:alpha-1,2-fucosyltransferase [Mucilaginibacter mali]|nr:alpha-1,2-fucosyltransferase [Mucilaginibacter mali]
MFQYAFGLSLSHKLNCRLYLDNAVFGQTDHDMALRNYELDIFSKDIELADEKQIGKFLRPGNLQRLLNKTGINNTTVYREKSLRFHSEVFTVKPPAYFEGFWQTEKYFNAERVRQAFRFNRPLNHQSAEIATEISQQVNPVSMHIRRGDYVSSKTTNELHGLCSINYYKKATTLINEQLADPHFYIFSDDPEWVGQNLLPCLKNATLVHHNPGADSWQDMALMNKCKHHIIANSSFSWWGAWLSAGNEKTVIAPKNWFAKPSAYFDDADIVPSNWIKLPND